MKEKETESKLTQKWTKVYETKKATTSTCESTLDEGDAD